MNIKQMNNYKKHPKGLDLMQLPQPILERYTVFCEYAYIEIDDYNEIPVPMFALFGLKQTQTDIAEIPLNDYAKGFIEGYNSNLIPFIDTPESRKEIVLKEAIFKGGSGFCAHYTGDGYEYWSADMFESGIFEGKRYKAWEILFQTPNAFIEWFLPPQQSINIPVLKDNTEDKEKAQNILIVLSGLWLDKEKIMTDDGYKKVIEGVYHLINSGEVLSIDQKIKTSAPMQFIRRLFWKTHNELYTKKSTKKEIFVNFLHAYFECFSQSELSTTKNNFKEYRNGDFNNHYTQIMESIKK